MTKTKKSEAFTDVVEENCSTRTVLRTVLEEACESQIRKMPRPHQHVTFNEQQVHHVDAPPSSFVLKLFVVQESGIYLDVVILPLLAATPRLTA